MHLNCPNCGAQIQADDMNLTRMVAKCRACHSVFNFGDRLDDRRTSSIASPGGFSSTSASRGSMPQPKRLTIENVGTDMLITRRWFSPTFLFMILFCTLWDGFLVVWYLFAFTNESPLAMKLAPLLHVAVGLGITYWTLCGLLNRTVIRVSPNRLAVTHTPLPWFGAQTMNAADLQQLYRKQRIHRSKSGTSHAYEVYAITRGGQHIKLLSGLEDPDQALYVEHKIEERLGIRNEPVWGEMKE